MQPLRSTHFTLRTIPARAVWQWGAVLVVLVGSVAALAGTSSPAGASSQNARTPVLVELFTSEGCSSCPPADRLLESLIATQPAAGAEIIGIGEHVDYWDRLGWRDVFSSTEFTSRQESYVDRLGTGPAYTPQMVVDGTAAFVGSDRLAARQAIDQAAVVPHGKLTVARTHASNRKLEVTVTASDLPLAPEDRADIVVAIVEDGIRSDVKRGENAGKVLTHAAVARSMRAIGQASGPAGSARAELLIAPDWKPDKLRVVAFVQARKTRRVIASAVIPAFGEAAQPGQPSPASSTTVPRSYAPY